MRFGIGLLIGILASSMLGCDPNAPTYIVAVNGVLVDNNGLYLRSVDFELCAQVVNKDTKELAYESCQAITSTEDAYISPWIENKGSKYSTPRTFAVTPPSNQETVQMVAKKEGVEVVQSVDLYETVKISANQTIQRRTTESVDTHPFNENYDLYFSLNIELPCRFVPNLANSNYVYWDPKNYIYKDYYCPDHPQWADLFPASKQP